MKDQIKQPDYLDKIDELREDMINDLRGLVQINSVKSEALPEAPFGQGVKDAFHYMLDLGRREGFKCVNADEQGGHIDYGTGSEAETMGILCHLDVVPEGSGWDHEPFGGEIKDGIMYGRGTADDKGPTIAAFYAMKALKDCGYKPRKKVRMVLGLDEETGSEGMHYYLKKEKAPDFAIVPDSDFPLVHGEMGIMVFDLVKKLGKPAKGGLTLKKMTGGNAPNMVPDSAKALIYSENGYDAVKEHIEEFRKSTDFDITGKVKGKNFEVICKGVSAHGAMPWKGLNAVFIMMAFLAGLDEFNCEEVNDFIHFFHMYIGFTVNGEGLDCDIEDDISGPLIMNVGMAELNSEYAKLTINIRVPISYNAEEVYKRIAPHIENYDIGIVKQMYQEPVYFSVDEPLVQTLLSIYRKHTGDNENEPLVIGGGTYAREMKNAIAFGAQYPGDPELMHQKNECINLDRLVQTAKIYADALYELAVSPKAAGE